MRRPLTLFQRGGRRGGLDFQFWGNWSFKGTKKPWMKTIQNFTPESLCFYRSSDLTCTLIKTVHCRWSHLCVLDQSAGSVVMEAGEMNAVCGSRLASSTCLWLLFSPLFFCSLLTKTTHSCCAPRRLCSYLFIICVSIYISSVSMATGEIGRAAWRVEGIFRFTPQRCT